MFDSWTVFFLLKVTGNLSLFLSNVFRRCTILDLKSLSRCYKCYV